MTATATKQEVLRVNERKVYSNHILPPSYYLGSQGVGCAFEPPGHPRYFVKPVYTRFGNTPPKGPSYMLNNTGFTDLEQVDKLYGSPQFPILDETHPATIAWMKDIYSHFHRCYHNGFGRSITEQTLIYPVPSYKLKTFIDDPRFSEEWATKAKQTIELENEEIETHAKIVATPENHMAVRYIRKHYPDHQPILEWIEKPPMKDENWYGTLKERPDPDKCPGQYGMKHPVNGTRCQFCGWHKEEPSQPQGGDAVTTTPSN